MAIPFKMVKSGLRILKMLSLFINLNDLCKLIIAKDACIECKITDSRRIKTKLLSKSLKIYYFLNLTKHAI